MVRVLPVVSNFPASVPTRKVRLGYYDNRYIHFAAKYLGIDIISLYNNINSLP